MNAPIVKLTVTLMLALSLALNGAASALTASQQLHLAQGMASNSADVMLICTGSDVRWISESAFLDTGQIIEVAAPSEAPDHWQTLDCSSAEATEPTLDVFSVFPRGVELAPHSVKTTSQLQQLFLNAQYASALSRAPPTTFIG
ncbi:hypothetical protein [Alteromonas oceanisediminis]|uniref:hypothetical protein n=1 Tax=Alteromonas oceanisediminis TaxID=2836180 RepID=UPI001BD98B29|nr:hypothetical protein [Alteromonas oceanisediminis]MBT0586268.1 hypothetical protein [Alteromonas oceanisediminis]